MAGAAEPEASVEQLAPHVSRKEVRLELRCAMQLESWTLFLNMWLLSSAQH